MLVLLPPSETKRPGGGFRPLRLDALALGQLTARRDAVMTALEDLSADPVLAARVLKLGPTQHDEIAANAVLRSSRTMAAIDRYTGVLYDALDAASLDAHARRWLGANVLIHTAPFGPVGALDRIPAYRLGAAVALPGSPSLRRIWSEAVSAAIADLSPAFVLDLRSEAYTALGPVPASVDSVYVRVVSQGPDGVVRALNHFNKHAKGAFVRALAVQRPRIGSLRALHAWAGTQGIALRAGSRQGEIELVG